MIETLKAKIANFIKPHKKFRKLSGQAMVEFALALPILLMVVYGLLETGRLLFIYGSTVTATRQAARYGSANGISANAVPYYRDCAGIEGAVNNVAFIHTFNTISITYDRGLDSSGDMVAIPGFDADPTAYTCDTMDDSTLRNGDRIKVQATAVWSPIVRIVPSWQGFTITSSAERTIITGVAISDNEQLVEWSPGFTLAVSASPTTFDEAGDTINYTYTISNVGSTTLNGAFSVADDHATPNCSSAPGSLAAGGSFTCSGTHTITQAEVDAGVSISTSQATSGSGTSNVVTLTITGVQTPGLTLQTSGAKSGSVINYTYTLLNSGKVTLTSPYTVTASSVSVTVDCSAATSSLAPNTSTTCTGVYNLTGSEGTSYTSIATATATFDIQTVTSNATSTTTNLSDLTLSIQAISSSGNSYIDNETQNVNYTYTLSNVGISSLSGPFTITDNRATGISCPAGSISPSSSITCTGSYNVTQSDMNAGLDITNQATASNGSTNSNQATSTITITQNKTLTVSVSPSTTLATTAGTVITYTYTLTNTSNVTLTSPYTVADIGHTGTITCSSVVPLAPNATTTCTASYTVTATDISNGSIISAATATAKFGALTITSAQATATVITFNSPRITLSITSSPTTFTSAGVPLNFTFTIKNTGNVALSSPYTVSGNLGAITCPSSPAALAIGATVNCTATYNTTASDVSASMVNVSATATALNGAATLTSNTATLSVPFTFQCYVYHRLAINPTSITYPGPGQRNMAMSVISDAASGGTIYISNIQLLNWNYFSNSGQYVSSISFGGVQIATGNNTQRVDPVSYGAPYSGDVSLTPGSTKTLLFIFNRNYIPLGNEIIKITFTNSSCPVLDSSNNLQVK